MTTLPSSSPFSSPCCSIHNTTTTVATNTTLTTKSNTTTKSNNNDNNNDTNNNILIRPARYHELSQVADMMVESFYTLDQNKSPWRRLYVLGELNRLQLNYPWYPYHLDKEDESENDDNQRHEMLVAVIDVVDVSDRRDNDDKDDPKNNYNRNGRDDKSATVVVAFCDVDGRHQSHRRPLSSSSSQSTSQQSQQSQQQQQQEEYWKRPYLSDLIVRPTYRRQGLARRLIQTAEEFVLCLNNNNNNLNDENHDHSDSGKRSGCTNSIDNNEDEDDVEDDDPTGRGRDRGRDRGRVLYIRVEATNKAALKLYMGDHDNNENDKGMGYQIVDQEEVVEGPQWKSREENKRINGSKIVYTLCKKF